MCGGVKRKCCVWSQENNRGKDGGGGVLFQRPGLKYSLDRGLACPVQSLSVAPAFFLLPPPLSSSLFPPFLFCFSFSPPVQSAVLDYLHFHMGSCVSQFNAWPVILFTSLQQAGVKSTGKLTIHLSAPCVCMHRSVNTEAYFFFKSPPFSALSPPPISSSIAIVLRRKFATAASRVYFG